MHYIYLRFIQFLYFKNTEFCKIYIFFADSFCKRFEQNIADVYLFSIYLANLRSIALHFCNKTKNHCINSDRMAQAPFKLEPMLNLEKVIYRFILKKLDKRKGLGH